MDNIVNQETPSLKFYSVSDEYIRFLRSHSNCTNVYDNKENARTHTRKYIGILFQVPNSNFNYYAPLSSPKPSDYSYKNGIREIRKSIIPIYRIVTKGIGGQNELNGTLRLSNMIPVPATEIAPYDFSSESDLKYKDLVEKEYRFIITNRAKILSNASVLYKQKMNSERLLSKPAYLDSTLNFRVLENLCSEYIQMTSSKDSECPNEKLEKERTPFNDLLVHVTRNEQIKEKSVNIKEKYSDPER